MAYFSQGELETYLGSTISAEDYAKAESYAKERIEDYCQQVFVSTEVEDEVIYVGELAGPVVFAIKPVQSITSIVDQDGLAITAYVLREYGVNLTEEGVEQLTVSYTAGYTAVPEPIKRLALYLAKTILVPLDKPTPAVASISVGGTSYSFIQADVLRNKLTGDDTMDAIANQYRRHWWSVG